jgi:hypothetical protein
MKPNLSVSGYGHYLQRLTLHKNNLYIRIAIDKCRESLAFSTKNVQAWFAKWDELVQGVVVNSVCMQALTGFVSSRVRVPVYRLQQTSVPNILFEFFYDCFLVCLLFFVPMPLELILFEPGLILGLFGIIQRSRNIVVPTQ